MEFGNYLDMIKFLKTMFWLHYSLETPGCLMEKKISNWILGINKVFQNIWVFQGVHHTDLLANLR